MLGGSSCPRGADQANQGIDLIFLFSFSPPDRLGEGRGKGFRPWATDNSCPA